MDELIDRTIHIDIDLELHGEEVQGRATSAGLPDQAFTGWVGLIAALDAMIGPPSP